jgi:hypothetical protein
MNFIWYIELSSLVAKKPHFSFSPQNLPYVIAANPARDFSNIRAWRKGDVKK